MAEFELTLQNLAHEINRDFFSEQNVGTRQNLLAQAILSSTHNVCFGSKIRKIGMSLQTPVFLYKGGVEEGIHFTCFPDKKFIVLLLQFPKIISKTVCLKCHNRFTL